MTAAHHPTPNLWVGPGAIKGELPAGMVLQRESGAPCAIGDVLPENRVAVAREPREPEAPPIFEPPLGEDEATTAKRRALHGLMHECGTCDPGDVYDVPAEDLDRDIAAHGGAKE